MPALDNLSRAAEISFTVARRAGSLALSTVRQVAGTALARRSQSRRPPSTWAPPPPVSSSPGPTRSHPSSPPPPAPASPPSPSSIPELAPDHVDRQAVLVAESADAGAGDGAGAQVRIGEPWKGYGSLTAKEVNDRLAIATPESLALARLYESANRNRVTVIREIDRRLKAADA